MRLGLGTLLYGALFEEIADRDIHRIVAGIAQPNPASNALHERFGFKSIGTFSEVGAPSEAIGALVQPGLREHFQKLLAGAHVDGLGHDFPLAVVHEALGNSRDPELFVHLSPRIQQHGDG
jgi:hypothetical protein